MMVKMRAYDHEPPDQEVYLAKLVALQDHQRYYDVLISALAAPDVSFESEGFRSSRVDGAMGRTMAAMRGDDPLLIGYEEGEGKGY